MTPVDLCKAEFGAYPATSGFDIIIRAGQPVGRYWNLIPKSMAGGLFLESKCPSMKANTTQLPNLKALMRHFGLQYKTEFGEVVETLA